MQSKIERLSSPTSLLRKLSNSPYCLWPPPQSWRKCLVPKATRAQSHSLPTIYFQVCFQQLLPTTGTSLGLVELVLLGKSHYHHVVENCQKPHSPGVGRGPSLSLRPYHLHHPFYIPFPTFSAAPHADPKGVYPLWLCACTLLSNPFPPIEAYPSIVPFPANLIKKFILLWWWFIMWCATTYQSFLFLWCFFFFLWPLST